MEWNEIVPNCIEREVPTLNCLPAVLQKVIYALFLFAGIAGVFFIIFSGIKFLLSGGDAKQLEGAKQTLTYAIIGFIVILLSVAIINLISLITGVDCIRFFGFTNCST